jgi:hypothetical protein
MIQLFLNSIFRSSVIIKRIDFVMYKLKISEPLWSYLQSDREECSCTMCVTRPRIVTY